MTTKLIGIKWLFLNIGLIKTAEIVLNIFLKISKEYLINFKYGDKEVAMLIKSERTDLAMLTEIFCFEAYEIKKDVSPELIVDGGANKGSVAIYFGLKYPNAKIHCYEPNVNLIPILRKNIELNNINAEIFNEALSNREGELFFEINENHQYSKLSEKDTSIKVRAVSINGKYSGQRIDILKLDIEGEEEKVIQSIDFKLVSIGIIIQEIHYDRVNFEKIESIIKSNEYEFEPPYSQYKLLNSEKTYPILIAIKK